MNKRRPLKASVIESKTVIVIGYSNKMSGYMTKGELRLSMLTFRRSFQALSHPSHTFEVVKNNKMKSFEASSHGLCL